MVRLGRTPRDWVKQQPSTKKDDTTTSTIAAKPKHSSSTLQVGRVSSNVIASIYAPLLMETSVECSELYAKFDVASREYEQALMLANAEKEEETVEVAATPTGDETNSSIANRTFTIYDDPLTNPDRLLFSPLTRPVLFATPASLTEFTDLLKQTSRDTTHSSNGHGKWKSRINAARFERKLDERYGFLRPLITHPRVYERVKSIQRKHAMGHFNPIQKMGGDEGYLSLHSSVILLFMMHRNQVRAEVVYLTGLWLIVGLQPWALVILVVLGVLWVDRRRCKKKAGLGKNFGGASVEVLPYYCNDEGGAVSDEEKSAMLDRPVGDDYTQADQANDMKEFDVIVVGSGPEALYPAALLSRAGKKVCVLSPLTDAAGLHTLTVGASSYPVDACDSKACRIQSLQRMLKPSLANDLDAMGGVRFAKLGREDSGFVYEVLDIPQPQGNVTLCLRAGNLLEDISSSTTLASDAVTETQSYLNACQTIHADASQYYISKIIPPKTWWGMLLNQPPPKSTYGEASIRLAADFLRRAVTKNNTARTIVSAIGNRNENLAPGRCSMGVHVTSMCQTLDSDGGYYPVGGVRSLGHAWTAVIESFGGRVFHTVPLQELVFAERKGSVAGPVSNVGAEAAVDEEAVTEDGTKSTKKKSLRNNQKDTTTTTTEPTITPLPPVTKKELAAKLALNPPCLGVKLQTGVLLQSKTVLSTLGVLPTFLHLVPESVRTPCGMAGIPLGLPALSERRPLMQLLLTLKGTSGNLELMDGADYTRVPNAGVDDEGTTSIVETIPTESTTASLAVAATHSQKLRRSKTDNGSTSSSTATTAATEPAPATSTSTPASAKSTDTGTYRNKFEGGKSWMKVSFPSAKDPTWHQRFPKLSTCVITIEADDDFVRPIEGSKPQMYAILPKTASASGNGDVQRLIDRVCNDVVEVFPQLGGKILSQELRGPIRAGLSQTPERFAAPGIKPRSPYPNLFIAGSDITVNDSFSGKITSGLLAVNDMLGYNTVLDHFVLEKDIIRDLERFMSVLSSSNEDVAVPMMVQSLQKDDKEKGDVKEKVGNDAIASAESSKEK